MKRVLSVAQHRIYRNQQEQLAKSSAPSLRVEPIYAPQVKPLTVQLGQLVRKQAN